MNRYNILHNQHGITRIESVRYNIFEWNSFLSYFKHIMKQSILNSYDSSYQSFLVFMKICFSDELIEKDIVNLLGIVIFLK